MKFILLSVLSLLSFSSRAESEYLCSLKVIHGKMIEAKKAKDHIIRSTRGQADVPRSRAIHDALSDYKEKILPLMNEENSLKDRFYGKATPAEEALVSSESERLGQILHDESAMEEAAKEIDMTAYSN